VCDWSYLPRTYRLKISARKVVENIFVVANTSTASQPWTAITTCRRMAMTLLHIRMAIMQSMNLATSSQTVARTTTLAIGASMLLRIYQIKMLNLIRTCLGNQIPDWTTTTLKPLQRAHQPFKPLHIPVTATPTNTHTLRTIPRWCPALQMDHLHTNLTHLRTANLSRCNMEPLPRKLWSMNVLMLFDRARLWIHNHILVPAPLILLHIPEPPLRHPQRIRLLCTMLSRPVLAQETSG
jgi:hypothetical protein